MIAPPSPRPIYFHEDDYAQIEILPAQNRDHCAAQLGLLAEFAEQHSAQGLGWTDAYVRQTEPISLAELKLPVATVVAAITPQMQPFTEVSMGYAGQRELCPDTLAFGFHPGSVLYLAHSATQIVEHLWLGLDHPLPGEETAWLSSLANLNRLGDLLLVDWQWECLFQLDNTLALTTYLQGRINQES